MKPTYFDLTVHDIGCAKEFFNSVLGWRFEKLEMAYQYYRIQAGPPGEQGIDGGVGAVRDAPLSGGKPMTRATVAVAGLDQILTRVSVAGGSVVEPKIAIRGVGWYATCAEPGGLMFGAIQADSTAG